MHCAARTADEVMEVLLWCGPDHRLRRRMWQHGMDSTTLLDYGADETAKEADYRSPSVGYGRTAVLTVGFENGTSTSVRD